MTMVHFKTLFVAAIMLSCNYNSIYAEVTVNPHDFERKDLCPSCHGDIPMLSHDPMTTCTKCHPGNVGDHPFQGHPTYIRVSKKVDALMMPLTHDGWLVCYTCHDYHNRSGFKRMLRIEYESLCRLCHINK